MSDECTCHICPPCSLCVEMTEEESEVYANGGLDALRKFREEKEEQEMSHDFTRSFWGNNIFGFYPCRDGTAVMIGVGPKLGRIKKGDFIKYKSHDETETVRVLDVEYESNPPDYFRVTVGDIKT